MSNRFKILCPECGCQSTLSKLKYRNTKEAELSCYCNNVECGHSFSLNLSYSHTLAESKIINTNLTDDYHQNIGDKTKLKITCPSCGDTVITEKTNRKHVLFSDIYCHCKNPLCGHRFVSNLSFSHTISPSAAKHGRLIQDLINSIPPAEREKAIDMLRQASQSLQGK